MASYSKYKTKSGKEFWRVDYTLGTSKSGRPVRSSKRGFKRKRDAEKYVTQTLVDLEQHGYNKDHNATYKQVYDYFIKSYKNTVKESTLNRVLGVFKHHILPILGNYQIRNINVPTCQNAVNTWSKDLSDYRKIKAYASLVFKQAKKIGIIYANPMDNVTMPKFKKNDISEDLQFYDKYEVKKFFECLTIEYENKNYQPIALFRLLAFTGMRKGEALALKWSDIDLLHATLNINKSITRTVDNRMVVGSPKTSTSTRTIDLDAGTVKVLRQWQTSQKRRLLLLGYNSGSKEQLVFTSDHNTLLSTTKPNKYQDHVIKKYGLKHIKVHAWRHTFASLAFEAGATIKQVQEQLGHSDVQTTLNIYSHVSKYAKKDTVDKFAQFVGF
ncbi:tyrosine-type recombinase/integrase [Ligilactobacillus acidipiscis]|uniref:tyrosine-type recombinase/integrase n=1 Tax=Ligilactobacillus acidipiscis TaxID=89059 RepID=UPI00386864B8